MKRISVFILSAFLCASCVCDDCCNLSMEMEGITDNPVVLGDLSNQRVSSFAEDEHGHVWIGTYRGVNKSTGREYHQYFSTEDGDGLPDNQVSVLYKDSRDRMWVGTVNGVSRYTDQDTFITVPVDSDSKNTIQIFENLSGRLFLNTANSICVYDPQKNRFDRVLDIMRVPFIHSTCHIAPNNDLWVVTPTDMKSYCSTTLELKDSLGLSNFPTYSFMTDDGLIWLSGYSGLTIYDTRTGSFSPAPSALTSHPKFRMLSLWEYILTAPVP